MWRSKDNFLKLIFSFHNVGYKESNFSGLVANTFYLLNHLSLSRFYFLSFLFFKIGFHAAHAILELVMQ